MQQISNTLPARLLQRRTFWTQLIITY